MTSSRTSLPNAPPPAPPPDRRRAPRWRGPGGRWWRRASHRPLGARADAHPRVAERIDDDHRLGLTLGDEVVHDVVGAPGQHPARVDVAGAVQQVENGIARVAALVAGRRIDPERARHAEALRVIRLDANGAMRHVARVIELVARDLEHARRRERAESKLDRWIGRVHRDDAVDVELIVVDVWRERPDLHFPDAVLVLRHRVGLAIELADERDLFGIRGAITERDRLVRIDFGRDYRRPTASAATALRRRGRPGLPRRWLTRRSLRAGHAHCEHAAISQYPARRILSYFIQCSWGLARRLRAASGRRRCR